MNKKCPLLILLITSTLLFSILGIYWNNQYYDNGIRYTTQSPPVAVAMKGLYDGKIKNDFTMLSDIIHKEAAPELATRRNIQQHPSPNTPSVEEHSSELISETPSVEIIEEICMEETSEPASEFTTELTVEEIPLTKTIEYTNVSDDYFSDAVFLGDSRTVGIQAFSGITNATFLCKESLTIYDYDKKKIKYNNTKTSIKDVLSNIEFGKIYIMFGINECSYGTTESYFEAYENVVNDIKELQPNAIIFIEGNLYVTQERSKQGGITNNKLAERNAAIATLANQQDIFYIDVNESTLCHDNALVKEYTWDHVHIKAQYYSVWKDFLLNHGIAKTESEEKI